MGISSLSVEKPYQGFLSVCGPSESQTEWNFNYLGRQTAECSISATLYNKSASEKAVLWQ